MKRDMLPPLAVLAVILAFALWNSSAITDCTFWVPQPTVFRGPPQVGQRLGALWE